MSSDMMIICKEDKSGFDDYVSGEEQIDAFFVTECSMGEPWDEFGLFVNNLFCGAPGILEQIYGQSEHYYKELTEGFAKQIISASDSLESHKGLDKAKLKEYLNSHVGMHLSTENW